MILIESISKLSNTSDLRKILKNICFDVHREYQQIKNIQTPSTTDLKEFENIWLILNNIEYLVRIKRLFSHQYIVIVDLAKAFEMAQIKYSTALTINCINKINNLVSQYDLEVIIDYSKTEISFLIY